MGKLAEAATFADRLAIAHHYLQPENVASDTVKWAREVLGLEANEGFVIDCWINFGISSGWTQKDAEDLKKLHVWWGKEWVERKKEGAVGTTELKHLKLIRFDIVENLILRVIQASDGVYDGQCRFPGPVICINAAITQWKQLVQDEDDPLYAEALRLTPLTDWEARIIIQNSDKLPHIHRSGVKATEGRWITHLRFLQYWTGRSMADAEVYLQSWRLEHLPDIFKAACALPIDGDHFATISMAQKNFQMNPWLDRTRHPHLTDSNIEEVDDIVHFVMCVLFGYSVEEVALSLASFDRGGYTRRKGLRYSILLIILERFRGVTTFRSAELQYREKTRRFQPPTAAECMRFAQSEKTKASTAISELKQAQEENPEDSQNKEFPTAFRVGTALVKLCALYADDQVLDAARGRIQVVDMAVSLKQQEDLVRWQAASSRRSHFNNGKKNYSGRSLDVLRLQTWQHDMGIAGVTCRPDRPIRLPDVVHYFTPAEQINRKIAPPNFATETHAHKKIASYLATVTTTAAGGTPIKMDEVCVKLYHDRRFKLQHYVQYSKLDRLPHESYEIGVERWAALVIMSAQGLRHSGPVRPDEVLVFVRYWDALGDFTEAATHLGESPFVRRRDAEVRDILLDLADRGCFAHRKPTVGETVYDTIRLA